MNKGNGKPREVNTSRRLGNIWGLGALAVSVGLSGCTGDPEPPATGTAFARLEQALVGCQPVTYEAESMSATAGGGITGGWNIWSNGELSTTHAFTQSPTTLTVYASGTVATGQWPTMVVSVGATTLGTVTVASTTYASYAFTLDALAGNQAVRIAFTNDYYANGEDRNLLIDKIVVACDDVVEPCLDGVKNGEETDTDCGGEACAPCAAGLACIVASDCESAACEEATCVATSSCEDGVQNGAETDLDCGGGCEGCLVLSSCAQDTDCANGGLCLSELEQPVCWHYPACNDGVMNGFESDVDCGGAVCEARCRPTQKCATASDCTSGSCQEGVCNFDTACFDGVRGGGETDVDCGGECTLGCQAYQECNLDSDCASGFVCTDLGPGYPSICYFRPDCMDGEWNGFESDVDCGGTVCDVRCRDGQRCTMDSDCAGGSCIDGACSLEASCSDGVLSGSETDTDCGGALCGPCANGALCLADVDCLQSSTCNAATGQCERPETCKDSMHNRDETDVDCGGSQCDAPCLPGEGCLLDSDCSTNSCVVGVCQPYANCFDGEQNGTEGAADCGGNCAPCADSGACTVDEDCLTASTCIAGQCQPGQTCRDGVKNQDESDVDCGGTLCEQCVAGKTCAAAGDCYKSTCMEGLCQTPSASPACDDAEVNGYESDVDCGGPDCNPCGDGADCQADDDCTSGVCVQAVCQAVPSCSDDVMNGTESDVDCGGGCGGCQLGEHCDAPGDCLSDTCGGGVCKAPPSQPLPVQFQLTSDWQTGYCVNITVTNTTGHAIAGWSMRVALNQSRVSSSWSSTFGGSNPATVTPASWNAALAPGAAAYLGYCAGKTGPNWYPRPLGAVSQ